jgi:hypothetical protein
MSSGEGKVQDLDAIMAEIESAEVPKEDPETDEQPITSMAKRTTADDLDDRREFVWSLRQRGKTYREISETLVARGYERGTSIATVKSDIDYVRRKKREKIEFHDREDYLAGHTSIYDDVRKEAWRVYNRGDNDQRIKALNLIRQTTNDERKALQDTGVVRKENMVQETVQIGLVAKWDDSDVGQAASALIASQLNLHLAAPTADIDDAEIVEDDDDSEEEDA